MKKEGQKRVAAGFLAALLFLGLGRGMALASYENPYQYPKTIRLRGEEKAAYLDQKTWAMFTGKTRKPDAYTVPKGWQQDLESLKSVRVEKYMPDKKKTKNVLFFLHGGGYILGNSNSHRDWAIAQSHALGNGDVYMLDYRYAPAGRYPAALTDAVAAYRAILASGVPAERIILAGDSAGGNLATVLALYCRDHELPMPAVLVLYSPWEDAGHLPTHDTNAVDDVVLGKRNVRMFAAVTQNEDYFRDANLKDPYVSPVYADLRGLPPTLIIGGAKEMFVDDMLLFAGHARQAGVKVDLHLFPGMSHDWPLIFPELPEAKKTYELLDAFVGKHT